jgi:HD-like signal output (HDOD) protein
MAVNPALDTDALVRNLDALPAQQAVAMRVLHVSGDRRSSAGDLGNAVLADPSITAQVMKVANSAYYGLSGRVAGVAFAVTVVGFNSIRSVVAGFAAGALGERVAVPPGLWDRAAASAAAASILAPGLGASKPDAFSVCLLHELGDFLLFRASRRAYATLHQEAEHWDCQARSPIERELFGADHGQVLAHSLSAWLFPEEFVDAVACHAEPDGGGLPLGRAVLAAQALGALSLRGDDERRWARELEARLAEPLAVGGVSSGEAWPLSRQTRREAEHLAASFAVD